MTFFKYLFFVVTFAACTTDLSNSAQPDESNEVHKLSLREIIELFNNSDSPVNLETVSSLKSLKTLDNQIVYSASFDRQSCEEFYVSDPSIETFLYDQYFIFFSNTYNLSGLTDLFYLDFKDNHTHTQYPEFIKLEYEDYFIILSEIVTPLDCARKVEVKFLVTPKIKK